MAVLLFLKYKVKFQIIFIVWTTVAKWTAASNIIHLSSSVNRQMINIYAIIKMVHLKVQKTSTLILPAEKILPFD